MFIILLNHFCYIAKPKIETTGIIQKMQTILLIDDDIMEFRLIKNMLEDCFDTPFALKYANTLAKGIEMLETQKVDILLLDDKLNSGLTAVDSVPALRAVSENIPFIIISNAIDADYLQNKSILDVYDIVDKYHIRNRIRDGLLSHSVCA